MTLVPSIQQNPPPPLALAKKKKKGELDMSTEKKFRVSLVTCDNYEKNTVRSAMRELLAPLGGLDFVSPGMTVAI